MVDILKSKWVWIPNEGIGVFKFGTALRDYMSTFSLREKELDTDDNTDWVSYELVGTSNNIYTEDGKITAISCEDEFIYKNKNLIGMTEQEFIEQMGQESSEIDTSIEYDDGSLSTPFEYKDLGLIAWFENNKLLSVSCTNAEEEDLETQT